MHIFTKITSFLLIYFALIIPLKATEDEVNSETIEEFLSNSEIRGNQNGKYWNQRFFKDSRTIYESAGNVEHGYWRVENNKYCSQWPPRSSWACYDVELEGENITFIAPGSGTRWPAKRINDNIE